MRVGERERKRLTAPRKQKGRQKNLTIETCAVFETGLALLAAGSCKINKDTVIPKLKAYSSCSLAHINKHGSNIAEPPEELLRMSTNRSSGRI